MAVPGLGLLAGMGVAIAMSGLPQQAWDVLTNRAIVPSSNPSQSVLPPAVTSLSKIHDRPRLDPLPKQFTIWECDVVVVGGSLGGIAAASQAMQAGAQTCLIELAPWLGGQISAQGVSALDESLTMRSEQNASSSWQAFKQLILQQTMRLPTWSNLPDTTHVADVNSCWVGLLCFPPSSGATAAEQLLQMAQKMSPNSRWSTSTAFKGAAFDVTGKEITAVYAVQRTPLAADYVPQGRLSQELPSWYGWSSDAVFKKAGLMLQAPAGKRMIVIDATDTGELVGWAGIPHRLGSEARSTTNEANASDRDNPSCTQAFTYPFVLGIYDDGGASRKQFAQVRSGYARQEHRNDFDFQSFPMFDGRSVFNYRRIVSTTLSDPDDGSPASGDLTLINWNRGNDWAFMDPPLILTDRELAASGQRQNWMGGVSLEALRHAENHALLFAEWILEKQSSSERPLTYLAGGETPMGTRSGLSMMPYIREGRRILGRSAYGQSQFMLSEADIRADMPNGRDVEPTVVAVTHYDVDMHGCRYRNGAPTWEATAAPTNEFNVLPVKIPLESLIPQDVDNLLIGGKAIAVTHIVNAVTRIHYSEWSIGAAAGATAGWLAKQSEQLSPNDILADRQMPQLKQHLRAQGLRLEW